MKTIILICACLLIPSVVAEASTTEEKLDALVVGKTQYAMKEGLTTEEKLTALVAETSVLDMESAKRLIKKQWQPSIDWYREKGLFGEAEIFLCVSWRMEEKDNHYAIRSWLEKLKWHKNFINHCLEGK